LEDSVAMSKEKAGPSKSSQGAKNNMKVVAENRKARHDYSIEDTFEAGIELLGSEVKSVRKGDVNLKDSYVAFVGSEAYLQNAHISEYRASSYMNHLPERKRKLLLNRIELDKISRAIEEKGLTCVPLKVYFKGGWAKVEIAIVRGKKAHDKRESIKGKDAQRELEKARRHSR
jgi:SsrA-binding protein